MTGGRRQRAPAPRDPFANRPNVSFDASVIVSPDSAPTPMAVVIDLAGGTTTRRPDGFLADADPGRPSSRSRNQPVGTSGPDRRGAEVAPALGRDPRPNDGAAARGPRPGRPRDRG